MALSKLKRAEAKIAKLEIGSTVVTGTNPALRKHLSKACTDTQVALDVLSRLNGVTRQPDSLAFEAADKHGEYILGGQCLPSGLVALEEKARGYYNLREPADLWTVIAQVLNGGPVETRMGADKAFSEAANVWCLLEVPELASVTLFTDFYIARRARDGKLAVAESEALAVRGLLELGEGVEIATYRTHEAVQVSYMLQRPKNDLVWTRKIANPWGELVDYA
jgi:hypothetical protein